MGSFNNTFPQFGWVKATLAAAVVAAGMVGCASQSTAPLAASPVPGAVQPGTDQETFDTPDAAVAALLAAVQSNDHSDLNKIFGPGGKDLSSGDPVEDADNYKAFAEQTLAKAQIEERSPTVAILHIGENDWPFPIPITKADSGKWYFDTTAGQNEILARRIGANELETISMARAYVDGQREYASEDRDGSGVLKYAQYFRSHPGQKDGLYWEAADDQPQSPFSEVFAQASTDGYFKHQPGTGPHPFHGYYYHILTKQGMAAPGGKYNYVINGNMIAGFGLIAYPDSYGKSGVMTFIISHQGKLYQKDLGPETPKLAREITAYNPDSSWTLVK
jgi:Protein of unknown function (DUF2950)